VSVDWDRGLRRAMDVSGLGSCPLSNSGFECVRIVSNVEFWMYVDYDRVLC
jgi:hypothetical protein